MKKISLILSMTALVSACSQTIKEIKTENKRQLETSENESMIKNVESLHLLLNSEAPNLALAQLLARSVSKEQQENVKELIKDFSAEEAKAMILEIQRQNGMIRENYLFHGQKYQNNVHFISQSLLKAEEVSSQSLSFEGQLHISVFAYIKNKALDEIISIYDKRATELSKDLSKTIAFEIGHLDPQVAADIEKAFGFDSKEKVIEMIKKTKPLLERIDKCFRSSDFNYKEQAAITAGAILAAGIYKHIEDNAGFKKIVKNGMGIVRDVKEFQAKMKEFTMLITSLETHIAESSKNIHDLKTGMSESGKDLVELYNRAKIGLNAPVNIESKKVMEFLYNKVIKGQDTIADGSNSSIISKQYKINLNFQKSVIAAGNLADNLSNIINTTTRISQILGIKPSKGLQNALDKAQKVSAVINTTKTIMAGFALGGPLGAATALCSSPMMSMMGGGGGNSAKLDEINRKLDMVLKNQQRMIDMQIDTMNMIKELALMVDIYHQKEMTALAELRDISLVSLEINKALLNKDVHSCERMINFQLSSVWKNFDFRKESFYSINNIRFFNNRFSGEITGLNDVRRIANSVEENGFENCQSGIAEAFGGNANSENPIRSIFASDEGSNLNKFSREVYLPLLDTLAYLTEASSFDSIPLHLPVSHFKSLKFKSPYVDYAAHEQAAGHDIYDLQDLISSRNLERYLGHLIILYPLIEVDKPVWSKSYGEIINTYLMNSNSHTNQNIRSHYFLNNALKLIQSAIAQEALLAGEPILHRLHLRYAADIFSSTNCKDIKNEDIPYIPDIPFFCSLRRNKLLLKNLVGYLLNYNLEKNADFEVQYKTAFEKGDLPNIAKLFNTGLEGNRFEVVASETGKEIVLNVNGYANEKVSIKIPRPEDLKEGKILYSENMPRLLMMQEVVFEALAQVAPIQRHMDGKDFLKLFLMK